MFQKAHLVGRALKAACHEAFALTFPGDERASAYDRGLRDTPLTTDAAARGEV